MLGLDCLPRCTAVASWRRWWETSKIWSRRSCMRLPLAQMAALSSRKKERKKNKQSGQTVRHIESSEWPKRNQPLDALSSSEKKKGEPEKKRESQVAPSKSHPLLRLRVSSIEPHMRSYHIITFRFGCQLHLPLSLSQKTHWAWLRSLQG